MRRLAKLPLFHAILVRFSFSAQFAVAIVVGWYRGGYRVATLPNGLYSKPGAAALIFSGSKSTVPTYSNVLFHYSMLKILSLHANTGGGGDGNMFWLVAICDTWYVLVIGTIDEQIPLKPSALCRHHNRARHSSTPPEQDPCQSKPCPRYKHHFRDPSLARWGGSFHGAVATNVQQNACHGVRGTSRGCAQVRGCA
jgi:hypothetical protein